MTWENLEKKDLLYARGLKNFRRISIFAFNGKKSKTLGYCMRHLVFELETNLFLALDEISHLERTYGLRISQVLNYTF